MPIAFSPWRGALTAVVACLLLPGFLRADSPAQGDAFLRDYAQTRGFMLGRPVKATPTPDGKSVLFLRAASAREPSQELYVFDVASGQTRRLLSPQDALKGAADKLSPEEKARRERQRISVGGFTAFSISKDGALVLLELSGKLYNLALANGVVAELPTGEGTILDPKFSPDSKYVSYVRNQDVCVLDLWTGKERAVTTGGTETLSHGLAEFVAQEEMDRFSGYWWAGNHHIVYQENDASKVESWFASDPAQPGNEPLRSFYPRPGKENVAVRLGVAFVDAPGNIPPRSLEWDHTKYPYLGKVTAGEHGPVTLTVLSRDQTDLALLACDLSTGKTTPLLTEHDDAWVNLDQDVPRWLPESDGGGFLWTSERAGRWQLERRGRDGSAGAVLVPPAAGYVSLVGVAGGQVYYMASADPTQERIGHVLLAGGTTDAGSELPREGGMHLGVLGENEAVIVDWSQDLGTMPHAVVRRLPDGVAVGELPSVALEPPFTPRAEVLHLGPGEGFKCAVVRPRDFHFAAGGKYPVIVDVYGGPHHQQVTVSMRAYLLDQWLADQGFIVVLADGRGTPGRGRDWERAIAGHFGSVPLDDQVAALRLLGAEHPELDLDRVGITGWSFGGYMSALAVLRRPDVFKAAVAGAPVVDWMDYDTCYTERYLGVPDAGRWTDAYKEGSLLTYAADLKRPLLLIHGTADDNVYLRHSLRLIDALFRAGRPFEFLPLSSFTHMVPDPVVRIRLEERIVQHFKKHLAPP